MAAPVCLGNSIALITSATQAATFGSSPVPRARSTVPVGLMKNSTLTTPASSGFDASASV